MKGRRGNKNNEKIVEELCKSSGRVMEVENRFVVVGKIAPMEGCHGRKNGA